MNGWEKVKLGEICGCITDGTHQAPPKTADGIPFITISNIDAFNQIDLENTMYVPFDYYDKMDDKRKVHRNDILYSVVGSFGKAVFMQNDVQMVFQRHIALLRPDESKVEPRFLYYAMLSDKFYMQADAVAIGAAQRTITLSALRRMQVNIPSIQLQQHIVSVLSAYDNLIDNYRRQIKLLEEAAQRLYKEWFVDLRFPGHEHTKIVDGVPEGWDIGVLKDIGEFKRGKTITKEQVITGNIPVIAGGLEPAYYHNKYNTESPVITVSGSGANAGFTRLYNEKVWASDCSFLDASKCNSLYFVYCFLKSSKAAIDNLQKGAAQPHVYAKDLNRLAVSIPSRNILARYSMIVQSYFDKIKTCQLIITNAQEARDRLLPKLMSGEIKV